VGGQEEQVRLDIPSDQANRRGPQLHQIGSAMQPDVYFHAEMDKSANSSCAKAHLKRLSCTPVALPYAQRRALPSTKRNADPHGFLLDSPGGAAQILCRSFHGSLLR